MIEVHPGGKRWTRRVQPYLGAALLTAGLVLLGLGLLSGKTAGRRAGSAGTGGMMALAGLGLVFRDRPEKRTGLPFVVVAVGLAAAIVAKTLR